MFAYDFSRREQAYIVAHVTGLVSASALWIGANQLDPNEGWQWSDTTPYNYKYWQAGNLITHSNSNNNFIGQFVLMIRVHIH